MTAESVLVIKGRDETGLAFSQVERKFRRLNQQAELFGKVFRGGAIVGAIIAFERLAESAEKAAESIGDRGTARSLRLLNREIDTLKAKGLNVIGAVLGGAYASATGDPIAKYLDRVRVLRKEIDNQLAYVGGDRGKMSPRAAALVAGWERELALLEASRPAGVRTRAPGSRGGGSAVWETPWLKEDKVKKGPKADPMAGLGEINVWQREIFNLANEQERALAQLSEATSSQVQQDIRQSFNELSRELNGMTGDWFAATTAWSEFSLQAARNMQDAFAEFLFDPFQDGVQGMLKGFVDVLRQMLAQYLAIQAFLQIGGALAKSTNPFLAGIGGFLQGARASGGPVSAGGAYLVGERGPELFVPRASGMIMPNGAGGSVVIHQHIDARGADASLRAALPGIMARTKAETIAAIADLQRRGRLA